MFKGKLFAVVGHKHWGKSKTLAALTDGNTSVRQFTIKSHSFFVRRMSNDDIPDSFYRLVNGLEPESRPHVILALCPTITNKKLRSKLIAILTHLRQGYGLFFFVLRNSYDTSTRRINDGEIQLLERFGKVKLFSDRSANPKKRALALRRFIARNIIK
jgi:hypothetical protein